MHGAFPDCKEKEMNVYIGCWKYSSVNAAMERHAVENVTEEKLEEILGSKGRCFVKHGDGDVFLWTKTFCSGSMYVGSPKAINE